MTSADPDAETCFYTVSKEHLNWLRHKKLSHLNFKNINKFSIGENEIGLPKMKFEKDRCVPYVKNER